MEAEKKGYYIFCVCKAFFVIKIEIYGSKCILREKKMKMSWFEFHVSSELYLEQLEFQFTKTFPKLWLFSFFHGQRFKYF